MLKANRDVGVDAVEYWMHELSQRNWAKVLQECQDHNFKNMAVSVRPPFLNIFVFRCAI